MMITDPFWLTLAVLYVILKWTVGLWALRWILKRAASR